MFKDFEFRGMHQKNLEKNTNRPVRRESKLQDHYKNHWLEGDHPVKGIIALPYSADESTVEDTLGLCPHQQEFRYNPVAYRGRSKSFAALYGMRRVPRHVAIANKHFAESSTS